MLSKLFLSISLLCGVLPTAITPVFAEGETTTDEPSAQSDTSAYDAYKVESVTPKGVTFDLFDYWTTEKQTDADDTAWGSEQETQGINNGHALVFSKSMSTSDPYKSFANAWTGTGGAPYSDIVQKKLVSGYPVLNSSVAKGSESLNYLFDPLVSHDGKESYSDVTGLLQLKNGYYYYTSHENMNVSFADGGNETGNFASYNAKTNSFDLYSTYGVANTGTSPTGQFFPFNTADQVFKTNDDGTITQSGITSTDSKINHYFGMHMTSYFMQPEFGETNNESMTFEFSGDDDVWIYIDGALIGDLGGIHDECSITINFKTGEVKLYQNLNGANTSMATKKQIGETKYLSDLYTAAGVTLTDGAWGLEGKDGTTNNKTYAKDTYHTLDMFYMERGNTDSNLSLKFNLVPPPESDITKVDQSGEKVSNAQFALYEANENYEITNKTPIASGTTDINGKLVFVDSNGTIINFDNRYLNQQVYYVLKETSNPTGYRSMHTDAHLHYIHNGGIGSGILECTNKWDCGVWAGPKEAITVQDINALYDSSGNIITFNENDKLYAVIFKRNETGTDPTESSNVWQQVSGNVTDGLTLTSTENLLEKYNSSSSDLAAGGFYELTKNTEKNKYSTTIEDMPGDIEEYYHWVTEEYNSPDEAAQLQEALKSVKYTIGFFVAKTSEEGTTLTRVSTSGNPGNYSRQFGTRLYITDVRNSLVVQKVDWKTSNDASIEGRNLGITGAMFTLYKDEKCTDVYEGPVTTKNLERGKNATISITGAAVFTYLPRGTYYLKETAAPKTDTADYAINDTVVKVIVDENGVYAYAGDVDENGNAVEDGVSTLSGVGTLIDSMAQFGTNNAYDNTLTDIIATKMTGTMNSSGELEWTATEESKYLTAADLDPTSDEGEKVLEYQVNTYASQERSKKNSFKSTSGWTWTSIKQDPTIYTQGGGTQSIKDTSIKDKDVTHLFSRTVFVQIGNKVETMKAQGPTISKTLIGDVQNEETFTFQLKADGANAIALMARDENKNLIEQQTITLNANTKTGSVTFNSDESNQLTFPKEEKEYRFEVSEVAGSTEHMDYDSSEFYATAKVEKGEDGNWSVTWTYAKVGEPSITSASFTNYYTEPITVKFSVQKTLSGMTSWSGSYDFKLVAIDNAPMPETTTATVTAPASGLTNTAEFSDITYSEPGTYVYDIEEVVPTESARTPGMTYSAAMYRVTVTVTRDDATGKLSADVKYLQKKNDDGSEATDVAESNDVPNFTNTYDSDKASWIPRIQKNYTDQSGYYPLSEAYSNFSFTLTALTGTNSEDETVSIPMPNSQEGGTYSVTLNNAQGLAEMTKISYDRNDIGNTYTYKLSENAGALSDKGMSYDSNYYEVTVKVEQESETDTTVVTKVTYQKKDSNGNNIGDSFSRGTTPSFDNTYNPTKTPVTETFTVSKTLTGRAWDDDDAVGFKFALATTDTTAPMPSDAVTTESGARVSYVTVLKPDSMSADQTTNANSFGEINYESEGTYFYTITEEADRRYLKWDETAYRLKVEVVWNETEQRFDVTKTITTVGDAKGKTYNSMSFTNVYEQPKETELVGSTYLRVKKTVETEDEWKAGEEFTFTISAVTEGAPLPSNTSITLKPTKAGEVTIGNFGNIKYSNLNLTSEADTATYQYKITETAGKTSYMTYDSTEYYVTVTVRLDEKMGGYTATAVMTKGNGTDAETVDAATFTNKYKEPKEIKLSGSEKLKVSKELTGREWTAESKDTYSFTISSTTGQAPLPNETTITLSKPESGTTASASFGDITFDKVGTYNYTISENIPLPSERENFMHYDGTIYSVTVKVKDNTDKTQLEIESVTWKKTSGSTTTDVTDNDNTAKFTNTYKTPDPGKLEGASNLKVKKTLSGRDWTKDDQFTFKLVPENKENPMPEDKDGTVIDILTLDINDKDNGLNFGDIYYSNSGTYKYTIEEVKGSDPSITYSSEKYDVTVTVTGQTGDPTYTVTSEMKKQGSNETVSDNTATFSNTYTAPTSTTAQLSVTKTLLGTEWGDHAFSFVLSADEETYPMPSESERTVTLTKDSTSSETSDSVKTGTFGSITYKEVGTYTYTIKEQVPEDPYKIANMVYDERENHVTVKVTLNSDNTLSASASYTFSTDGSAETDSAYFTNTYKNPGTLTGSTYLKVSKTLSGREWNDEQFTFVLNSVNATTLDGAAELSVPMPDVSTLTLTKDNQSGYFGNIVYSAEGIYNYTISEVAGDDPYTINDASVYNVQVTVKYNERDYKYEPVCVMSKDGSVISDNVASFNNINAKYELDGSTYLQVEKELSGRSWNDDETYTFTLTSADGAPMPADAVNGVSTLVLSKPSEDSDENDTQRGYFGNIVYAEAGEYHYTISEVIPAYREQNMFYDESTYDVSVTVNVNGDGTYSFDTTMTRNDGTVSPHARAVFYNEYKEPEKGELPGDEYLHVSKILTGREWGDNDSFEFTITADEEGNPLPTHTTIHLTKERQDAGFEYLTFDHEGVYHYTIKETAGHEKNMTYDVSTYHVTVTVTYDEVNHIYVASSVMKNDKDEEVSEAVFTNTYVSKKPSSSPSASASADPSGTSAGDKYNPVDTSDSNSLALFGGMLVISLACVCFMLAYKKKYSK